MDSADHISTPHAEGNRADATSRATALRARIRELRDGAIKDGAIKDGAIKDGAITDSAMDDVSQPGPSQQVSGKVSDTRPSSTTEIEEHDFASLARLINSHAGTIPAAPDEQSTTPRPVASRLRWQYPSALQLSCTTKSASDDEQRTATIWRKLTPVWLISAVFHVLLLVTLALLTYSQAHLAPAIIIAGNHADPEVLLESADDIEIGNPDGEIEESLWNPDSLDSNLLDLEASELAISNALEVPQTSFDMQSTMALSEQHAAQRLNISGDLRQGGKASGAQFYGIQAQGDRFVFIVDSSTSMRFKFAEAKRELELAVRRLREDQLFYVIFFDRNAERLRLGKWNSKGTRYSMKTRSEPNLVPATAENINALVYWMNTIQLDSDTNPHPAVVYALRKLAPDAIFLLSDGEFNDGGSTEVYLEQENLIDHPTDGLRPKTIVHCVGFYSRQGEITLKRIAAAHGGTYRFIEPRALAPIMNPFLGGRGRLR